MDDYMILHNNQEIGGNAQRIAPIYNPNIFNKYKTRHFFCVEYKTHKKLRLSKT